MLLLVKWYRSQDEFDRPGSDYFNKTPWERFCCNFCRCIVCVFVTTKRHVKHRGHFSPRWDRKFFVLLDFWKLRLLKIVSTQSSMGSLIEISKSCEHTLCRICTCARVCPVCSLALAWKGEGVRVK